MPFKPSLCLALLFLGIYAAEGTSPAEPVPVASSEVQVVRVKRKKKKAVDGASKKKVEA
jgi:hypothetical protein